MPAQTGWSTRRECNFWSTLFLQLVTLVVFCPHQNSRFDRSWQALFICPFCWCHQQLLITLANTAVVLQYLVWDSVGTHTGIMQVTHNANELCTHWCIKAYCRSWRCLLLTLECYWLIEFKPYCMDQIEILGMVYSIKQTCSACKFGQTVQHSQTYKIIHTSRIYPAHRPA